MTIYKYFSNPKIAEDEGVRSAMKIEDLHPLYAITNDKEKAKRFEKEHNMKFFYKIKEKDAEPREWREFANRHVNKILQYLNYTTKGEYDEEEETFCTQVTLLSNQDERMVVDSFCEDGFTETILTEEGILSTPPFIFKDKYIECLKAFQYPYLWRLSRYYKSALVPREEFEEEDFEDMAPDYLMDELMAYIIIYGQSLSGEFMEDNIVVDDEEESED